VHICTQVKGNFQSEEIFSMPDKRTHRGPGPADVKLFSEKALVDLRGAVADYSLLLTKDYGEKGALKLVGDKFALTERQRIAVMRSACSNQQLESRKSREMQVGELRGQLLALDGYNVLITIEAAMSGGIIFKGRDGCFRDLASIHGTYRKVTETIPAVELIGKFLKEAGIEKCLWFLDSPVSNSGRLKTLIGEIAGKNGWDWEIKLTISPDAELIKGDHPAASSDSVILDGCKRWVNLARAIIESRLPNSWVAELC
jgi:hypothetical protein